MKQVEQTQFIEQDAERMIRMGAVRRTRPKARFWMTMYILTFVIWFGVLVVFLVLITKNNQNKLYSHLAACFIPLLVFPAEYLKKPLRTAMEAYRDAFLQSYGPFALGTVFTELQLRQGRSVSRDTIADTEMMFPGTFLQSRSIIQGRYRSVPLYLSEIRTEVTVRRVYKSGVRYVDKTIFRGQWMTVPLNGAYYRKLQIIQSGFRNKKSRRSFRFRYTIGRRVSTKSLLFNLKFRVYAENPDDVDYVLTPDTMKQIQALASHSRGKLMLGFADGELHIVTQTRRMAFSPPCVFLPFRDEKALASIQREAAQFTQFIDALRLDNNLFRPEA